MKHTVQRGLTAAALRTAVPPRYRAVLPHALPAPPYTLLLFRSDRDDVVMSRAVAAVLADVAGEEDTLVAVGGGFTAEAVELLRPRRAVIVPLSEFYWTDESYRVVRERT